MMEKELVTLKRVFKGKTNADKEMIASLKKKRDSVRKRLKAEKENNRLVNLNIEEEKIKSSVYRSS
jgi:hypothetical protein